MLIFGSKTKRKNKAREQKDPRDRHVMLKKPTKGKIIAGIIIGTLLLICLALCLSFAMLSKKQDAQHAADRFAGQSGLRFSQATAFFAGEGEITPNEINMFRKNIDSSLTAAGEPAPESGKLYTDAYSAQTKLSVMTNKNPINVAVVGVGGDFFFFHPLRLRSGNYIKETDLMHDSVILDEKLAWQLFGSYDVAGMKIRIGEMSFRVAGVVQRENDKAATAAYSAEAGLFMHYDVINALSPIPIESYEICVREPIAGFAKNLLKDSFNSALIVQNTGRFSVSSIFKIIGQFGKRSFDTHMKALPYWENAAKLQEDSMALILVLILVTGIAPLIIFVIYTVKAAKFGKRKLKEEVLSPGIEHIKEESRKRGRKRVLKKEAKIAKEEEEALGKSDTPETDIDISDIDPDLY